MVCDALFTDFDGDGQTDLIVVGEWMPVSFFKNVNGKFKNISNNSGIKVKRAGGIPLWPVISGIQAGWIISLAILA